VYCVYVGILCRQSRTFSDWLLSADEESLFHRFRFRPNNEADPRGEDGNQDGSTEERALAVSQEPASFEVILGFWFNSYRRCVILLIQTKYHTYISLE
jgi:hypothetical protein